MLDNDLRRSDIRTEHEALPPIAGLKYSANLWLHQYDFRGPNTHGCDLGAKMKSPHGGVTTERKMAEDEYYGEGDG